MTKILHGGVTLAWLLIVANGYAEGIDRGVEVRAVRILWNDQIQYVRAAMSDGDVCQVVDVSRLKAAATVLDKISELHASADVQWENVPIDRHGWERAFARWDAWFKAHGERVRLGDIVSQIEKAVLDAERPPDL